MERRTNTPQESCQNNLKNFMDFFETLFKQIAEKMTRMDLDELAEYYEKKIDALIIKKDTDELLKYIGGEFTITYVTETVFSLKLALYFQDRKEEWVKIETPSMARDMKYLKERAVIELREKKKIIYDIEHPDSKKIEDPS